MVDVRKSEDATEEEKNMRDVDVGYSNFLPLGIVYIGSSWFVLFGTEEKRISVFRLQMIYDICPTGNTAEEDLFPNWSTTSFVNHFTFSPKDNDFIDERMVLAMELGTLTDDFGFQSKFSEWSKSSIELREGIQNLLLEWDLPRKK